MIFHTGPVLDCIIFRIGAASECPMCISNRNCHPAELLHAMCSHAILRIPARATFSQINEKSSKGHLDPCFDEPCSPKVKVFCRGMPMLVQFRVFSVELILN